MSTVTNMAVDTAGENITVYTTRVERIGNKKVSVITPPSVSGTPNTAMIADFQRIEKRWSVDGEIDESDEAGIWTVFDTKGVVAMTWNSNSYDIVIDKLTTTKSNREDDHRIVKFTAVEGSNIG